MANYENKPGFGALFRNEKAEGNQPSHRGTVKDPTGKEWQIAAWVKEGKKGKFFSLKLSEPYKGGQQQTRRDEPDDEIPW